MVVGHEIPLTYFIARYHKKMYADLGWASGMACQIVKRATFCVLSQYQLHIYNANVWGIWGLFAIISTIVNYQVDLMIQSIFFRNRFC